MTLQSTKPLVSRGTLPALQRVETSYEIANAIPLVHKLVLDRKRENIDLDDYFAGIYLAHREALLPFWRDGRQLDIFVRELCGLNEPVWWYWIDFYMWLRENAKRMGTLTRYSAPLFRVLDEAANLALREHKQGQSVPQLELRHFMSVLAKHPELEFTRKMLHSGMKPPRPPKRPQRRSW